MRRPDNPFPRSEPNRSHEDPALTDSAPSRDAAELAQSRRRGLLLLGGAAALALVAWGGWTWLSGASETTDDAYVGGNIVAVTARDPGTVIAIHADNTQGVKAGAPLVELDPASVDAQMDAAEAALARAVRQVHSSFTQVDAADAAVAQAQTVLDSARGDLARRQKAAGAGAVSGEEVSHAQEALHNAEASLTLAQARRAEALASVQGADVDTNPAVLAAVADLRRAAIAKSHMHITAPVDGVIAQRTVQLGQQIAAGTPLMSVVPLGNVWIDANFRETQLADLRVGQPVTVTSDAYGGSVTFHGKVVGLAAGSGNAFALLPPQNASGNWIKIVQRVPVRVALDNGELARNPLRVGLSVKVTVDTSHGGGAPVTAAMAQPVGETAITDVSPEVEARIRRIIAANAGGERR